MWTSTSREKYNRKTTRYQTDFTDAEWCIIEPLFPSANRLGRPRGWPLREIVNAVFYCLRSGCPWRLLPDDLPPWSTVYCWFALWRDTCLFEKINCIVMRADREAKSAAGRSRL